MSEKSLEPNFRSLHDCSSVVIDEIACRGHLGGPWHSTEHVHTAIQVTYSSPGSSMRAHWISDSGSKSEKRILGSIMCITPVSQPHSMEWDEAYGTVMMLIRPSLLESDDTHRTDLAWTGQGLYGERDPFLEHLCALLVDASRSESSLSRLQAESTAVLMLFHLNACQGDGSRSKSNECGRLKRVREFIHANLGEDLSIATLARIAQTSPFHFGRLFKASTGLSPHQYVLKERIGVAKRLLAETPLAIADIAEECGFSTQAHLTTTFRTLVGDTPKQFRAAVGCKQAQQGRFEKQVSKKE